MERSRGFTPSVPSFEPHYLNRVIALSFVVRTVEEQYDGVDLVGEKLLPYNIHVDQVSFF